MLDDPRKRPLYSRHDLDIDPLLLLPVSTEVLLTCSDHLAVEPLLLGEQLHRGDAITMDLGLDCLQHVCVVERAKVQAVFVGARYEQVVVAQGRGSSLPRTEDQRDPAG